MSMVERVARRQAEFDGRSLMQMPRGERERYMQRARLAIEAMREPTTEMYCAGDHEILAHLNSLKIIKGEDTPAVDSWRAMIDKALSEEEERG